MTKTKKLQIPSVANIRFLALVLKISTHGDLDNRNLSNIRDLISVVDVDFYKKDIEVYTLFKTVELVVNHRLGGVLSTDALMLSIDSNIKCDENLEFVTDTIEPMVTESKSVDSAEIDLVMNHISDYSQAGFLLAYQASLNAKFDILKEGGFGGISNTLNSLETELSELTTKLRKLKTSKDSADTTVFLNDEAFLERQFRIVYERSQKKNGVLELGIKMLNDFFSDDGGLYLGKMYVVNAPTNSFKTGTLLYMAKWIQQYNSKKYEKRIEETGRIPLVLFVSLENTWDENTARLYSMYNMKDVKEAETYDEALDNWKKEYGKTKSKIAMCLRYGKSGEFRPSDLEALIDELETQGYDVIATIIDYLKNMGDDHNHVDPRHKVISIATSLHEAVVTRPNMCLITAHHTNRAGDELLEDIVNRGGIDKVRSLGRHHLTEAHAVEEPIDFSMYVCPEISQFDGHSYWTTKKGKCRYKKSNVDNVVHLLENGFHLRDDIYLNESLSLSSIADTMNNGGNSLLSAYGGGQPENTTTLEDTNTSSRDTSLLSDVGKREVLIQSF